VNGLQVQELLTELELPERFNADIFEQFHAECMQSGHRTMWELFNALTAWSSHAKMKAGAQRAVTTDNREKRVVRLSTAEPLNVWQLKGLR
jgi:hypothetical protein